MSVNENSLNSLVFVSKSPSLTIAVGKAFAENLTVDVKSFFTFFDSQINAIFARLKKHLSRRVRAEAERSPKAALFGD